MVVDIFFMTKSPRKNVPDVGIELGAACMPSGHASDRATAPGSQTIDRILSVHPSQGETFYLRLLLHHKSGATSFQNLSHKRKGL